MNKILLVPLLAIMCLPACYKDPPPDKPASCPWPEVTTEGRHTLGFKVNGKEWVPCVDLYGAVVGLRPIDCLVTESDGSNSLSISITRSVKDTTYSDALFNGQIFIGFRPCKEGMSNIPTNFIHSSFELFADWEGDAFETIDTTSNNFINIIRLDTTVNVVSGEFQMTLLSKKTGRQAVITDGRFDLKYFPQ